jgi:hypothetical protein
MYFEFRFVLRDEDNDVIAISPTLPHMHKFKIDFVKSAVTAVQHTPALNNSANALQTPATADTNDDSVCFLISSPSSHNSNINFCLFLFAN